MARIKVLNKEYDKLKRRLEELIISYGGDFTDKQVNSKIKSTYRLGDRQFSHYFHTSYSDKRGHFNCRKDLKRGLRILGITDLSRRSFYTKTGSPQRQTREQTIAWHGFNDALLEHLISELPDE